MKKFYPIKIAFSILWTDIRIKRIKKVLKKQIRKQKKLTDKKIVLMTRNLEDLFLKRLEKEEKFKSLF